jgi:hypothetical protein
MKHHLQTNARFIITYANLNAQLLQQVRIVKMMNVSGCIVKVKEKMDFVKKKRIHQYYVQMVEEKNNVHYLG